MTNNWAKGRDVVGYVRSSGKGDDAQSSVPLQKQAIQECVAEAGGQVSDWYVDDARHSVSFQTQETQQFADEAAMQVVASYVEKVHGDGMKQSALQRLLAAAQSSENGFDVVVVWSLSRLSRIAEDLHVLVCLLHDLEVEVVSVSEPYTPLAWAAFYSRVTQEAQEDAPEESL